MVVLDKKAGQFILESIAISISEFSEPVVLELRPIQVHNLRPVFST
jgi:hypothetical protein